MSTDLQTPSPSTAVPDPIATAKPQVNPTARQCRICLDTDEQLAAGLTVLSRIDPALVRAAVFAENDLCIGCCIELGRQTWASTKGGLGIWRSVTLSLVIQAENVARGARL